MVALVLPKRVGIKNKGLLALYCVLQAAMLVFSIVSFITNKQGAVGIPSIQTLRVTFAPNSVQRIQASNRDEHACELVGAPHGYKEHSEASLVKGGNLTTICVPVCQTREEYFFEVSWIEYTEFCRKVDHCLEALQQNRRRRGQLPFGYDYLFWKDSCNPSDPTCHGLVCKDSPDMCCSPDDWNCCGNNLNWTHKLANRLYCPQASYVMCEAGTCLESISDCWKKWGGEKFSAFLCQNLTKSSRLFGMVNDGTVSSPYYTVLATLEECFQSCLNGSWPGCLGFSRYSNRGELEADARCWWANESDSFVYDDANDDEHMYFRTDVKIGAPITTTVSTDCVTRYPSSRYSAYAPAPPVAPPCIFPFIFDGLTFNACTAHKHTKPWCATKVNSVGQALGKEWVECEAASCPISENIFKREDCQNEDDMDCHCDFYEPWLTKLESRSFFTPGQIQAMVETGETQLDGLLVRNALGKTIRGGRFPNEASSFPHPMSKQFKGPCLSGNDNKSLFPYMFYRDLSSAALQSRKDKFGSQCVTASWFLSEQIGGSAALATGSSINTFDSRIQTVSPVAQDAVFMFTYTYELGEPVPWFTQLWESFRVPLHGGNSANRTTGDFKVTRTTVLDHHGYPWKTFAAGSRTELTAAEVVAVAAGLPDRNVNHVNLSHLPRSMFWDGAEFIAQVNCYNNEFDLMGSTSNRNLQHLHPTIQDPVCILRISFASWGPTVASESKLNGFEHTKKLGLVIVPVRTTSVQRFPDLQVVLLQLTSILVLMAIPRRIIDFFLRHCLGKLSKIYSRVCIEPFDLPLDAAAAAMQCVNNSVSYVELADIKTPDREDCMSMSRARVHERLKECLKSQQARIGEDELMHLSNFCFDVAARQGIVNKDGKYSGLRTFFAELFGLDSATYGCKSEADFRMLQVISMDRFMNINQRCCRLDMDELIELFDKGRRRSFLERCFTPPALISAIRQRPHALQRIGKQSSEMLGFERDFNGSVDMSEFEGGGVSIEEGRAKTAKCMEDLSHKVENSDSFQREVMRTIVDLKSEVLHLRERCTFLESKVGGKFSGEIDRPAGRRTGSDTQEDLAANLTAWKNSTRTIDMVDNANADLISDLTKDVARLKSTQEDVKQTLAKLQCSLVNRKLLEERFVDLSQRLESIPQVELNLAARKPSSLHAQTLQYQTRPLMLDSAMRPDLHQTESGLPEDGEVPSIALDAWTKAVSKHMKNSINV